MYTPFSPAIDLKMDGLFLGRLCAIIAGKDVYGLIDSIVIEDREVMGPNVAYIAPNLSVELN